ncbi:hypothetical protein OR1_00164 [Geobacter sp. OR-1]|uniref:hypothetical protein n=1 Tax=Geobacter sp. OR-1 TaxID=1266765 RepID=UPI00054332CB|nr:hypothetical protein [Geobacter sp. OR-1]GAM07895.1 hypothetical protein OR1_00164 [Geobacter sp. OR-1]
MNMTRLAPRLFFAIMMTTVTFCFNPIIAAAGQNPAGHEFRDPYKGGTRLPEGGGEPGKAYMALIDAVY